MARRAPLYTRRAPYGRHWRDFSEKLFVVGGRLRAPIPENPLEGLFGGTFRRWRAPSKYIFPVKHSRLEGAEQSQRAKGGYGPVPPAFAPVLEVSVMSLSVLNYSLVNRVPSRVLGPGMHLLHLCQISEPSLRAAVSSLRFLFVGVVSRGGCLHWFLVSQQRNERVRTSVAVRVFPRYYHGMMF